MTIRTIAFATFAAVAIGIGTSACSSSKTPDATTTVAGTAAATAPAAPAQRTTAAPTVDGHSLYTALLNTAWQDSELPTGVSSPKVGISAANGREKSAHVIGDIEVDVTGPDAGDAILYEVFPTTKDAQDAWDNGKPHPDSDTKITGTTTPPNVGYPAVQANGSITGKNAFGATVTNGASNCAALVDTVVVQGATVSVDNTDSGNVPLSCALLKAAIAHLTKVIASSRGG